MGRRRMSRSDSSKSEQGVTLVELILAIVIISIASIALLRSLGFQTRSNVDPLIQVQGQLLAKQYLEEVMSKPFFDPAADPRLDPSLSQTEVVASITDQTRSGDPARIAWNNIGEYNGYNSIIRDISGSPVDELANYSVTINVDTSTGLSLGSLSNNASASCPAQIALITVTIVDARGQSTSLSGYRTSYWQPPASWGC